MAATPADPRREAFGTAAFGALAALAAAAIGLPLHAPGLAEEWSIRWAFDRGQSWLAPDVLSTMPTRPLAAAPYALGRTLTPDSFLGEKLVLLALLATAALCAAALLARLVPGPAAAAGAALAVLSPADTSLFNTRDLPAHAAAAFAFLAILLLVRAAERPAPARLAAMAAASALALLTYESPLLVLLAAPAAVPLLSAGRRAPRSVLFVWYAVPLAVAVRAAATGGGYVERLFAGGSEDPLARTAATLAACGRMAIVELTAPLAVAARSWERLGPPGLAAVLLAAAVVAALAWRPAASNADGGGRSRRTLVAGLLFLVLGVLPFAVAPALRLTDRRVHLLGSFGAALALAAAVSLIQARAARALACGLLVAGAVAAGRQRSAETAREGERVSRIVRDLAEGAPSPPPGSLILVYDEPPADENVLGLTVTDVHLADALRVVQGRGDFHVLVAGRPLPEPWAGVPEPGPAGVAIRGTAGIVGVVPWGDVAVFRQGPAGRLARIDGGTSALPDDAGRLVPRGGQRPQRLASLCPDDP